MLHLEEKTDLNPLCPHCQQALNVMWCRELESFLGKRYVYFCPFCKKILGVSHRKGFWMG
ncbi:MAG: hypothetical protein PHU88_10740 [candidate division Zixibacteria bacterium]|nr:hypothetical protein [candidate division Zixibacteria bacterium]MDD5427495.1 hypothetical protein [candidate division Zixibacteria bacterium]